MARFLVAVAVVSAGFMVYAFVDCAMFERSRIRGLPKIAWLFLVALVPVVGALLWLFIGRGPVKKRLRGAPGVVGPDDDPDFLNGLTREKDPEIDDPNGNRESS